MQINLYFPFLMCQTVNNTNIMDVMNGKVCEVLLMFVCLERKN